MIAEDKLPTYTKILVPVDGSVSSQKAVLHAIALARWSGATLHILHVLETALARQVGVNVRRAAEEMRRQGIEVLSAAERRAAAEGVAAQTQLVEGRPGEAIVRAAQTEGASLIVMGATGYRDFKQLLAKLGSVSEYVVRQASRPVLVVRAT